MPKVREGTIALDAIVIDQGYLSRVKPITILIHEFAENMINGDVFPPIVVEEGTDKLISGYHRTKAYKRYQELIAQHQTDGEDSGQLDIWPEALLEVPCEWHTIPEGYAPSLYAASFNKKNSGRQSAEDNKKVCQDQWDAFPGCSFKLMIDNIGLSEKTIRKNLGDRLHTFETDRNARMEKLALLGWTHEEIAGAVSRCWPEGGLSRSRITEILSENGNSRISTKTDYGKHVSITSLAKRSEVPELVAWAWALEGLSDQERLDALDIKIQPYDAIHFTGSDERFGTDDYPGRIPGQLIAHILHWFTKSGDLVIDPMAGGGTTQDVCLVMGRQCYAYDINASKRIDILPHNIATDGWPDRTKKADLIFWDPPYFDKKDDGYPEGSISRLPRDDYLTFFAKAFAEAHALVKKGTYLAFLMSDWNDHDGKRPGIYLWDYVDLMKHGGWHMREHIQVPLSTQQVHPDIVNKFRAQGKRARLERYLLIAQA